MKRLSDQTLYEILEVPEDAAPAVIQAAWKRAHDIYGPGSLATYTLMSPDEADLLSRRIEEARATLLDPDARARYDEGLRRPAPASSGAAPALAALPPVIPAKVTRPLPPPPRPPPDEEEDEERDEERDEAEEVELPEPAAGAPDREEPREAPPCEEPAMAQPAGLLAAALAAAGPPVEAAPGSQPISASAAAPAPASAPASASAPVAPRPILLEREVSPAAAPAPAAAGAAPARHPEPPRAVPLPLVADGAWTGDALRQVREARGLSIQQIAERTKVTRHHIENIEADRFGALPAPVYLRGILLTLARELRLDGQKVARAYLDRAAAALAAAKQK